MKLLGMNQALLQDVTHLMKPIRHMDAQTRKRCLVRAGAAMIEANSYFLKQLVIHDIGKTSLSLGEKLLLREEEAYLKNNGEPAVKPAKLRTLDNIGFAYKTFYKVYNVDDGDAIRELMAMSARLLKIRDRLTHPKNPNELTVTDVEQSDVSRTLATHIFLFIKALKEAYPRSFASLQTIHNWQNATFSDMNTFIKSFTFQ